MRSNFQDWLRVGLLRRFVVVAWASRATTICIIPSRGRCWNANASGDGHPRASCRGGAAELVYGYSAARSCLPDASGRRRPPHGYTYIVRRHTVGICRHRCCAAAAQPCETVELAVPRGVDFASQMIIDLIVGNAALGALLLPDVHGAGVRPAMDVSSTRFAPAAARTSCARTGRPQCSIAAPRSAPDLQE